MDSEQWKRVDNLLQSVLERPPGEREEFLRRACGGDEALEGEVRSLLTSQQEAGSFLERPAIEVATQTLESLRSPIAQTISHYRILEKLGAGGMGVVYKAEDIRLHRFVALKFLPAAKMSDPERKRRFVQEARAASALNHPNIITIYDIDQADGADFIAMEYVPGKALDRLIPRNGLRLNEALQYATQVADALAAAHAAGIVHRDLKPGNVMVSETGCAKVLDFGLAKLIERVGQASGPVDFTGTAEAPKTVEGTVVGTVSYMSPEQAEGKKVDARTDIFSFGAMLYEMITGGRAFGGDSILSILTAILRDEPKPAAEIILGLPRELDRIVTRCLQKDPNRRYQHAGDLKIDLQQAWEELAAGGSVIHEGIPARQSVRRWWWLAATAAAGFLLAALWPVPPAGALKVTPFASEAEVETMPAWSPKGDRIAYVADVNGMLQIFTKALGLSTSTQMTHQRSWCNSPAWSDDGTRIYFQSAGGLYSVSIAGGQSQLVLSGFSKAAVSPDGKSLAVLRREADGRNQLAFSSPLGAPLRPYQHPAIANLVLEPNSSSISFTRDGRYLGVISDNQGQPQFWRIPVAGGTPERMAYSGRNFTFFSWLDQKRIVTAFTGAQYSPSFVTNLQSGASYLLTTGSARDAYPALSPDGRTLAYATGEGLYGIIEVPLNGSQPREVLASSRQAVAPSWAPDGTHFAYITNRSGVAEVWLRNQVDRSERRIASQKDVGAEESQFFDCAISPDGNRIAFRRWYGAQEIWISPVSGEPPVRLWNDPARVSQRGPAWSPDGNWIAYYAEPGGKFAILKIRVGANTPPELVTYASAAAPPQWSPLGNWIAFRDGHKMSLVSPDGRQERIISQQRWETYGWSKDGSSLYGIVADDRRHLILKGFNIASGSESTIADLGPTPPGFDLANYQGNFWYRGFSLHPSGKSFLTSVYRLQAHIWLMEDFDRPTRLLDILWKRP